MNNHTCLKIDIRPTDWVMGVSSKIVFKAVSTDWSKHLDFFERQVVANGDTDDCWAFAAQESFDAQMDALWPTLPAAIQSAITAMGFMDVSTVDNQPHFHSSPRFPSVLSGLKTGGGHLYTAWDIFRASGCVPWTALPVDPNMTLEQYFAPIPETVLALGKQFLALMGGKNFCQYHWINDGGATNIPAMQAALPMAPLGLGIPVNDGWNQEIPTVATGAPAHCVMAYAITGQTVNVDDHYPPFLKQLPPGYQMSYVLQAVVAPIFAPVAPETAQPLPAAPVLPAAPTVAQEVTWLDSVKQWLTMILNNIQGRTLTSDSPTMISYLKGKKTYIIGSCGVLYAIFGFFSGHLDSATAIPLFFGSLGMLGLRNGMTNTLEKFLQLAPDETLPPAAGSTS